MFNEEAMFDGKLDHLAQDVKDMDLEQLAQYFQSTPDGQMGLEVPMAMEDDGLFEDPEIGGINQRAITPEACELERSEYEHGLPTPPVTPSAAALLSASVQSNLY